MTGLRVMPSLGRENDAGGRFTDWPGPDSHAAHRISADATASYAPAARPDVARRADEADTGATPLAEGSVRRSGECVFTTRPPPSRGRSRSSSPSGKGSWPMRASTLVIIGAALGTARGRALDAPFRAVGDNPYLDLLACSDRSKVRYRLRA